MYSAQHLIWSPPVSHQSLHPHPLTSNSDRHKPAQTPGPLTQHRLLKVSKAYFQDVTKHPLSTWLLLDNTSHCFCGWAGVRRYRSYRTMPLSLDAPIQHHMRTIIRWWVTSLAYCKEVTVREHLGARQPPMRWMLSFKSVVSRYKGTDTLCRYVVTIAWHFHSRWMLPASKN